MKRILLALMIGFAANAQELPIHAVVTYLSSGTVYISPGRLGGVQDSMKLFIVRGLDTTAVLKVFAVSSKSAACSVVNFLRAPAVGDSVSGFAFLPSSVPKESPGDSIAAQRPAIWTGALSTRGSRLFGIDIEGRMSLQYYSARFDNGEYDFSQPALVMNVRASSRGIPLTLELYGNLRTLARGGASPLSSAATNESRVYRLSLEYNDGTNTLTLGRIMPVFAPSTGSIDGISYMRRFGRVIAGGAIGFQPGLGQRGTATNTRKLTLFARYNDLQGFGFTAAYGRTYELTRLDRESMTFGLNLYASGGISLYGYSDIDLRAKVSDRYELSPSLSAAIASASFSLGEVATVAVGIDVSRPLYPFSAVRLMPDSVLDRTVRSGASLTLSLTPVNGILLSNTFTPRSLSGSFYRQYANYSSAGWYNVLSTGLALRVSANLSANEFSSGRGLGVQLQRSFGDVDCSARYDRSSFSILQLDESSTSESFGVDIVSSITSRLSIINSFDLVRGYGPPMTSVFTELSWRF